MKKFITEEILVPLKLAYLKLVHINETPHKIALGFAVGAFVGVFPSFGLGGIVVLGLCYLFRLNYAGAILGSVLIMNPLTTPFFWALSAWVGSLIFSKDTQVVLDSLRNRKIFSQLGDITVIYLTGNLIVSTVTAAVSYFVVKNIVSRRKLKI